VHLAPALVGPPDPGLVRPGRRVFVEETEEEALAAAERHYGSRVMLTRDEDVLDTWFSSALWPFSTLGWPDETPELKRYYPTDVLVTGFDIIFFWVARMMMMGLHFMGEEPFHTVYIHALVRDEKGAEDVEVEGQRHRPARPRSTNTAPTRCASRWPPWRRRGATSSWRRAASRATATSAPSCGTPRASRDERLRRASTPTSIRRHPPDAQPLDRRRTARTRDAVTRASRSTASTRRRPPSTASSGTSSATGISNSSSRS
jgi:hypothetical protein